ncbi:hypothetical protein TSMEX_008540 [Taenia solium]|eukprot:TsM_000186400 transcript=TsM_000186400 gene=TsM_000186400
MLGILPSRVISHIALLAVEVAANFGGGNRRKLMHVSSSVLLRRIVPARKVTPATDITAVAGCGSGRMGEVIGENLCKWPELKSIIFDRKARLTKRERVVGGFNKVNKLGQKILARNVRISRLRTSALSYHVKATSGARGGAGPSWVFPPNKGYARLPFHSGTLDLH